MKIIMPMARPATVSVTQVEGLPTKGSARSARAGTSSSGSQSVLARGSSVAADGIGGHVAH